MSKIGFRPWDVSIDGKPYKVRIEITDRGSEYYDVKEQCNSDAEFVRFDSEMFVCWGIRYDPKNVIGKDILGKDCVTLEEYVTITRNGEDFYKFAGDINTGIDMARVIISKLRKHPFKFEHHDYGKNIIGRSVRYKNNDWIVTDWCQYTLEVTIRNIDFGCVTISIFDKDAVF